MSIKRLDNFGKINRKKVLSFSWENKNHFGYLFDHIVRGAGYSGNVAGYQGWDESAYFCCTK